VLCLAPRALEDSVRPRRLSGVGAGPLNFTVSRHLWTAILITHSSLGCNSKKHSRA
jgi:hypothetical protein